MKDGTILAHTIALVADHHKDDLYGEEPYIFHLLRVAKSVRKYPVDIQVLALFHDDLEDHPERAGCIIEFLDFVGLEYLFSSLTHISRNYYGEETYEQFIQRVIVDYRATVVKLADLQRNAGPKEEPRSEKHIQKALDQYIPAMAVITTALLEHVKARASEGQT